MARFLSIVSIVLMFAGVVCADEAEDRAVEVVLARGGIFLASIDNPPKRPDRRKPIEEVRFPFCEWRDEDMNTLAAFKQLKRVWFCGAKMTDTGMKDLERVKELEFVHIHGCKRVSGKGLKALSGCQKLRSIHLEGSVTDSDLKGLAALKGLREVSLLLYGGPVTGEGLAALSALPSLESLVLVSPSVTDAGIGKVHGLKRLRHLHLSAPGVTDAGLRGLSELKELETLFLEGSSTLSDAIFQEISGLTKLRSLRLSVKDKGLKDLAGLSDLRELSLTGQVTDAGLKEVAALKQLHRFSFYSPEVTAAGLRELAAMTELRELTIQLAKGVRDKEETQKAVSELRTALPKCKIVVPGNNAPMGSGKITVNMEDCQATRQRFPKSVLEALARSANDTLVKRGTFEVGGSNYTVYLPKAKTYSVKNTSKKDDPFENTSTLLVIDQNGSGKFTMADNWFANLPVRLGDKMFDVVDIANDGSKITLKPSKSPLRGVIVGRVCPEFSFKTADDKVVSRESLAGKPFLLDVWSIT